ncbi:MAG: hypothetical protein KKD73_07215 [Proteobacteria bacterium]|nr:hypothetical protein [Pseudomonadota bacterium]MBU1640229.1 hypothetical protein [Pseudomonadota bacterium]
MSKLFDTLEKIQEQEAPSPQVEHAARPRSAKKSGRYFPFLVGVTVIVAIVVAGKYLPVIKKNISRQTVQVQESNPASTAVPSSQISPAASQVPQQENLSGLDQVVYLNNQAVALVEKGDAWSALYYFDKASKLGPQQPEPLINMAVILMQMDLGFPAGRLFKQAYQLAPDNDQLLEAIELAIADQVLPPDFFETIPVPGIDGK